MTEFNLDTYLASQQAEGNTEGRGCFTVSHEKAAQKRAKFSLAREHAWALKIIQSAVAWDCRSISLKQSRTTSTFHLDTVKIAKLPSCQELVEAILTAKFESHEPKHSLATALRVIVERSHLSFMLNVDRGDGDPQSVYAGVHFGEMTEGARRKLRASWQRGLTLSIHHIPHTEANRLLLNYIPIRRNGLPLVAELDEYAYTCPIPLTLDGRRVDGLFRSPALGWRYTKKPLALWGLSFQQNDSPVLKLTTDAVCKTFTMNSPNPTAQRGSIDQSKFQAYLLLNGEVGGRYEELEKSAKSHIRWIRDGVIIQTERLDAETRHLSMELYINAKGLHTDLTGFSLRQDETYEERKAAALESAADIIDLELKRERDPCAEVPIPAEDSDDLKSNPIVGYVSAIARRIRDSRAAPSIISGLPSLKYAYPFELRRLWVSTSAKAKAEAEELKKFDDAARLAKLAQLEKTEQVAKQAQRKLNLERYERQQAARTKSRTKVESSQDGSDPDWLKRLESESRSSPSRQSKDRG